MTNYYTYWRNPEDGSVGKFTKDMRGMLLMNGWERITEKEYYEAKKAQD